MNPPRRGKKSFRDSARLCRVALLRVFRRLHCSAALPNAPLRFLRRWRRSAFRRPGCAVSHCFADFRRLHCSAALPNAPLRFLRRWRRSAPHTRDPLIKSQLLSQLTNTNGVVKIPHVVLLPKTAYKFLAHGL